MLQSEGVYRVGISEWLRFFKWDRNIVTLDSFSRTAGEHVWMVKKGFTGQWRSSLHWLLSCHAQNSRYIYAYINYWRLYIPLCVCVHVCICTCRHLVTSGRTWCLVLGTRRKRKKECLRMKLWWKPQIFKDDAGKHEKNVLIKRRTLKDRITLLLNNNP